VSAGTSPAIVPNGTASLMLFRGRTALLALHFIETWGQLTHLANQAERLAGIDWPSFRPTPGNEVHTPAVGRAGFFVKTAAPFVVSILQFEDAARLPIMRRPSLQNVFISSPVSFLKSAAEMQTVCPAIRFIRVD
jgi:hypothetical protein